jgi:hypothetical protein
MTKKTNLHSLWLKVKMKVGKDPNSNKVDKVLAQVRLFTRNEVYSLNPKMTRLSQTFKVSLTKPSWRQILNSPN